MFAILVDKYQEAFLRKASYILGSQDDAEDAVQDTFLKIYKHGQKFREEKGASFNSWAYKILVNTCYTYSTRKTLDVSRTKMMEFGDLDVLGSKDSSIGNEQASFVQSVLSRLPENLARLLSLYFFEGKNYEEIATMERTTLSAVKSGLYRAKKQFKNIALNLI